MIFLLDSTLMLTDSPSLGREFSQVRISMMHACTLWNNDVLVLPIGSLKLVYMCRRNREGQLGRSCLLQQTRRLFTQKGFVFIFDEVLYYLKFYILLK